MGTGTFLRPSATSGPPADLASPAPVATQEGTRTAAVSLHPVAPGSPRWSRERLPGRKGSWPPSSSLRAPPATPRPVTRTGKGRDGCVSSERAVGRGPRPPRVPTRPQEQRWSQHSPALPAWTPPRATAATPQLPARPGDAYTPLPSPQPCGDTPLSPPRISRSSGRQCQGRMDSGPTLGQSPIAQPCCAGLPDGPGQGRSAPGTALVATIPVRDPTTHPRETQPEPQGHSGG